MSSSNLHKLLPSVSFTLTSEDNDKIPDESIYRCTKKITKTSLNMEEMKDLLGNYLAELDLDDRVVLLRHYKEKRKNEKWIEDINELQSKKEQMSAYRKSIRVAMNDLFPDLVMFANLLTLVLERDECKHLLPLNVSIVEKDYTIHTLYYNHTITEDEEEHILPHKMAAVMLMTNDSLCPVLFDRKSVYQASEEETEKLTKKIMKISSKNCEEKIGAYTLKVSSHSQIIYTNNSLKTLRIADGDEDADNIEKEAKPAKKAKTKQVDVKEKVTKEKVEQEGQQEKEEEYIINPKTKRKIKVGSKVWLQLKKNGDIA